MLNTLPSPGHSISLWAAAAWVLARRARRFGSTLLLRRREKSCEAEDVSSRGGGGRSKLDFRTSRLGVGVSVTGEANVVWG